MFTGDLDPRSDRACTAITPRGGCRPHDALVAGHLEVDLLFISAIAQALLTQLGAAGEVCGLDRILKSNTVKTRIANGQSSPRALAVDASSVVRG